MANNLSAVQTTQKSGTENFYLKDRKLPIDVLSFWQWSSSELLGNALRGVLAEFIVASTIDVLDKPREEWDIYDLKTANGLKIEIKSSAYLQSWTQNKLSTIKFGIQPTGESQSNTTLRTRKSDIYVFCVLAHVDKASVDPLNLSQWDFYVLETRVLNEKIPTQKSIVLSSLLKLNPTKIKYNELGEEIAKYDK